MGQAICRALWNFKQTETCIIFEVQRWWKAGSFLDLSSMMNHFTFVAGSRRLQALCAHSSISCTWFACCWRALLSCLRFWDSERPKTCCEVEVVLEARKLPKQGHRVITRPSSFSVHLISKDCTLSTALCQWLMWHLQDNCSYCHLCPEGELSACGMLSIAVNRFSTWYYFFILF